jgi:hypothetical protein
MGIFRHDLTYPEHIPWTVRDEQSLRKRGPLGSV